MNDVPVAPLDIYNLRYSSPLYAEVRSITSFPDLLTPVNNGLFGLLGENTQSAGSFTISENGTSKEAFVDATFYNDDLELAPLEDEFLQIYE